MNGFAGKLSPVMLNLLTSNPDVASIHEDEIFTAQSIVTQTNAPWNLQRIEQAGPLPAGSNPNSLTYTYKWDTTTAGLGVDVYVLDTGINTAHVDFGGRASFGYSASEFPSRSFRPFARSG